MELISFAEAAAFLQVVFVDIMLAGDNAIVVAMVVVGLPVEQRGRVLVVGIAAATLMRVLFALVTVQLLNVIGLSLAGGLLLLWVTWKFWRELKVRHEENQAAEDIDDIVHGTPLRHPDAPRKTMRQAIIQVVAADVSMSLDNVLAVAGIAGEYQWVLVSGLVLSVAFMGLAATLIARLLARHHWIGFLGVAVILYVSLSMIWQGAIQIIETII
ncbi:MAG: YjbE family putative metal transport protein [Gammaproteobacteria bacterium]|nr:YjbE family putative metal transport protein [Gammaproteobacteria bacterium]